jgi:hypothetical protein
MPMCINFPSTLFLQDIWLRISVYFRDDQGESKFGMHKYI